MTYIIDTQGKSLTSINCRIPKEVDILFGKAIAKLITVNPGLKFTKTSSLIIAMQTFSNDILLGDAIVEVNFKAKDLHFKIKKVKR